MRLHDIPCTVLSLGRVPPAVTYPNVTFIAGDCTRIADAHPGQYRIDTGDTDFFGRNGTSAVNSILVRV